MILYITKGIYHLKGNMSENVYRDVPAYPSKSVCLYFPKPKAFYVNYCSPLTDRDLMSKMSRVSRRADNSTVTSCNGRGQSRRTVSVIWAGRKESDKEKKLFCPRNSIQNT